MFVRNHVQKRVLFEKLNDSTLVSFGNSR